MRQIIAIAGPTASGKTKTAIKLAQQINGEIVSADSMQCYKMMDIATAKPSKTELDTINHYMIDEFEPKANISVSDYTNVALNYIERIVNNDKYPIIAGGSGLYLDSIMYQSYNFNDNKVDEIYRKSLEERAETEGKEVLYQELISCDCEYAAKTHPNNLKRVIRALEFYHTNNVKMSAVTEKKQPRFDKYHYFGLFVERAVLYKRIDERVDQMIEKGLIEEVDYLYKNDLLSDTAKMGIGYKEVIDFICGKTDRQSAVDLIKLNSRHYAKRQYTWFRANKDIQWFDATEESNINKICIEMEGIIKSDK